MHDTPAPAAAPRAAGGPSRRPRIALIAALASNGVIGIENRLPWRLADDMRRFRALTTGHTIVMGRKTWDSIGKKPLPGRQNIVVTHQRDFRALGCEVAHSLHEAIALAKLPDPVFVIGGESLYREALPIADLLYLTEIHREFAGDARFPAYDRGRWRAIMRESRRLDGDDGFAYDFAAYERAVR